MNYELAKELKDAGFPQGHSGMYPPDQKEHDLHALAYVPTLEELIEACGDKILVLKHTPSNYHGDPESTPMNWFAWGGEDRGNYFSFQHSGYTPTEAVAHLWLALKKVASE